MDTRWWPLYFLFRFSSYNVSEADFLLPQVQKILEKMSQFFVTTTCTTDMSSNFLSLYHQENTIGKRIEGLPQTFVVQVIVRKKCDIFPRFFRTWGRRKSTSETSYERIKEKKERRSSTYIHSCYRDVLVDGDYNFFNHNQHIRNWPCYHNISNISKQQQYLAADKCKNYQEIFHRALSPSKHQRIYLVAPLTASHLQCPAATENLRIERWDQFWYEWQGT